MKGISESFLPGKSGKVLAAGTKAGKPDSLADGERIGTEPPRLRDIVAVSLRGLTMAGRGGGAQEYLHRVLAPWVANGCRVRVFCLEGKLPDGSREPEEETLDGVEYVRRGLGMRGALRLAWHFGEEIASADAVVENLMTVPLGAVRYVRKGQPFVAIKHHFTNRSLRQSMGFMKRMGLFAVENTVLPFWYRNSVLVANSEATKDGIDSRWGRWGGHAPVVVVAPPGFAHRKHGETKAERPTVLYVGTLNTSRKKVDDLIGAFREVVRSVPDAELVIAGDGPDRRKLEGLAEGLPIRLTGFLGEEGKQRWYERAWVFASPSLQEGFGITWVEAAAHGLPVVAYRIDGLDTLSEEVAVFIDPGNTSALAESIVRLLGSPDERARRGEAGRKESARFNWDATSAAVWGELVRQMPEG